MKFNLVKVLFNFRVTQQQQVWVLCWLTSLSIGIRVSISKYNAGSGLSALSEKVGSRSFLHRLGVNGLYQALFMVVVSEGHHRPPVYSSSPSQGVLCSVATPPLWPPPCFTSLIVMMCLCFTESCAWSCWLCLLVRIVVLIFWERVLLCCSSWPRTCHRLPSAYPNTGNIDV